MKKTVSITRDWANIELSFIYWNVGRWQSCARIATDLWFSFMKLEVAWTAEFTLFILFNEVLETAGNLLGSSTLTFVNNISINNWTGTGTSTIKWMLVCLFMIQRICIGGFWIFLQIQFCFDNNHVHAEYQFWNMELNEIFQVSWHQDFQLLNNISSYCQHDLLYGFHIYFHDHLCCENKMIMHNTTFVKCCDHFCIGPTFVKILHHIQW